MPRLLIALLCLLLVAKTHAGDVILTWEPPTKNTDGSTLTNLKGFKPYHGTSPTALAPIESLNNPGLTRYVVTGLPPGVHYFALMAYTQTTESELSGVVSTTVAADPPVCGVSPLAETQTQTCAAPLIGSWTQSRTYVSAAAPICWTPGPWTPATAPAGVCASPPQLLTSDTKAYELRSATLPLAWVGLVRIGLPCGPETVTRNGVKYCRVALWRADGAPQVLPVVWPQNAAGTEFWVRTP